MDALIAFLLSWIAANSNYQIDDIPHPTVIEMSAKDLTYEFYQGNSDVIPASGIDARIKALYSWEDGPNGTIYILSREETELSLSQETGLENPLFQETLLHELVHHIQYVRGEYERFNCASEGEKLAYELGGKFFKQHNIMDPIPNRMILANIFSRC